MEARRMDYLLPLFFALAFALTAAAVEDDRAGPLFIHEPINRVDFSNTTGATVECSAMGTPNPEIVWIRSNGTAVTDVPGLRQVLPNGNLVFPPFRAEDYRQEVHAQVYVCLARNPVGSVHSRDVNVRAVVSQHYITEAENEYVIRGNSAVMKCKIPSFVADFVSIDAWLSDSGDTHVYSKGQTDYDGKYLVLPSGELHIRDVGPEDGYKTYQCRTKHRLTGETRLSATKGRLVITEPTNTMRPKITSKGIEFKDVDSGRDVALLCPGQAFPVPFYRWYKFEEGSSRKRAVTLNERVKQVSGTLIIKEAVVADSGKYLCVVNNTVGGESVETVLTVTAPLSATIEPQSQTVDFGRPAVFNCVYKGNPVRTITWSKDGRSLNLDGPVLRIDAVKKEDKGMYQCFVRNDQESAQASAELKLGSRFDPPQIVHAFSSETLQPGPPVHLMCVASGNPTPEISWELDGKKLTSRERIQVGQYLKMNGNGNVVSHLNISSIQTADGGLYKCIASSKVGSVEHAERLNVYGVPFIRPMDKRAIVSGETLFVTCPAAGYPIKSITWERDGRTLPINRKQKVFPNGTLIIENVERQSDQATYTCVVQNEQGFLVKGNLEVQVMVPPHITPFAFEAEAFAGDSVQLSCYVSRGDLPLTVSWRFDGRLVPGGNEAAADASLPPGISTERMGTRNSVLTIESVSAAHSGNYTCMARNKAAVVEHTAPLKVNVPPRWILEPTDKAFAQGSDAKIECKADGFPKPSVTWKRAAGDTPGDYKDLKMNNPDIKVEDGTLFINNIQKSSHGYYLCEAVNGIGSGLSAVIMISVQAPPTFDIKMRNQTARRGEPSVLQCEAKGEKPIGILWNKNNQRIEPTNNNKYTIREENLSDRVGSDLSIKRTERSDSALFSCVATNAFGSDDTSINLIVQENPEAPYGLKVLDKSGRSVQLSWAAPYDGNSAIKHYLIEHKVSKGSWEMDIDRVLVPGQQVIAHVINLRPATTYHVRIVAENEIGPSDPSDTVTIITAEEAPSGPPTNVRVESTDQTSLKVLWKPPEREEWNGEILGYYVGYKLATSDKKYIFETVEFSKEEGKEHHLVINNLKTYTQYSVVIQAFNKVGAGPMSEEVRQYTAEGKPEMPPTDTTCTTLTSQTIRMRWVSPPLTSANGVIQGYKVVYGPTDTWNDESTKLTMKTASSETILHGLQKYTNYSMMVLAYTSGGDGVASSPIHCQTEQDVPEAPAAVKGLVKSEESVLISWKAPTRPNGAISQYTVYMRAGDDEGKDVKKNTVEYSETSFEVKDMKKNGQYEFWVTASTVMGEGPPSNSVMIAPNARIPAKIASFDRIFTGKYRENLKLPCLSVGLPEPEVKWTVKGQSLAPGDNPHFRIVEGGLMVMGVTREDAGEYVCSVENSFGKDTVTHQLVVHAPPHTPQIVVAMTTTNSITMKMKPHASDKEPISGYTVRYKPEYGDWETVQVPADEAKYTLQELGCGLKYQMVVNAFNSIGIGDETDILTASTKGSKPISPEARNFIEVQSTSVTLHLGAWQDGGCSMNYFVIEHKKKNERNWNQVANNVKPNANFGVGDLEPAQWYHLRVTAHNNAGFTVAEYEFATLTVTGGTIAPPERGLINVNEYFPWIPDWMDLNVVVPVAATIVVLLVGMIVICVAISRRSRGPEQTRLRDDVVYNQSMPGTMGQTMGKQRPDLHDELGYIAPPNRKLPPVPGSNYNTCDRIKRGHSFRSPHATWDPRRHLYEELSLHPPGVRRLPPCPGSDGTVNGRGMEDEICPYATFHLLGFREEMDPSKAMQFQTFPHQNGTGHSGTIGPGGMVNGGTMGHMHSRSGSQSMPRANGRYSRVGGQGGHNNTFSPEYDDPANCGDEEDQYGSQYGPYGNPYDHYGSRNSVSRRSVGSARNLPMSSSPEPPPPPPRNHDPNDSKDSNEISEAECDRDQLVNRSYGVNVRANSKDGMTTEEMRKLIERNEAGPHQQHHQNGLTAYDTVAV
ncbi:Down syndrome cell adhesion molecule-like protein Dscam2 isoform X12 [Thrips palmi]|uniref:Down syndrome cell adhesion molecule-like protein Dscam2 isoform X12 n=1 Tax=Thrips palmi TaxID=161013 RepID=A0A6P8XSZ5_THRPL|nr:Down syndrome cell adhesion molecule-like protein Dscam2 isoform X12 [Thrips palmi]